MAQVRRTKRKVTPKKSKPRKKRRKSTSASTFRKDLSKNLRTLGLLFRKVLLWATLVFLIAMGILLFSEYKKGGDVKVALIEDAVKEVSPPVTAVKEKVPVRKEQEVSNLEIPSGYAYGKEQLIRREGYTLSYNATYKIPNWVAYELTAKKASATKVPRYKNFMPDPAVTSNTDFNYDYSASDYDRGHMVPAGDMKWSYEAMKETFYFTNICPQSPKLNGGIWANLEVQCREWAKANKVIYIVAGPVIKQDMERMGKNRIAIPTHFFKVVCTQLSNGRYEGVGFLFENRPYIKTKIKDMRVPIDEVEKMTGIDFFPSLPDEVEEAMESRVNNRFWF